MSAVAELPSMFYGYDEAVALLTSRGLQLSRRTLERAVQGKSVPFTRMAGKVKFTEAQLAAIVAQHTHTPDDPDSLRPAPPRNRRGGR